MQHKNDQPITCFTFADNKERKRFSENSKGIQQAIFVSIICANEHSSNFPILDG